MSNVTNINSQAKVELTDVLQTDLVIDTTNKIPHAGGGHMIVGEKYEMFTPAAEGSAANLGIIWHDTKGYSFTYEGTLNMRSELYICTKDIHYEGKVIPKLVQENFDALRIILDGVSPLCPTYIADKLIRPVTNE